MKKALSVLLSLCMLLSAFMCLPFGVSAAEAGEGGTAPSGNKYIVPGKVTIYDLEYYRITSAEEFCYIEIEPSAKYALVADIELPSTYVPVASFSGWLRGYDDNTISDNAAVPMLHSIKLSSANGAGLFKVITSSGNAFQYIKTTGTVSKAADTDMVGAFAGNLTSSSYVYFTNCENYAEVEGGGTNPGTSGGFFGTSTGYPVLQNCVNYGNIKNGYYNGGFVGKSEGGQMQFINCINKGTIQGGTYRIAGIAGSLKYGSFTGCANEGDVTGYRHVAGLTGGFHSADGNGITIKTSYNSGNITSTAGSGSTSAAGLVAWAENGVNAEDSYNIGNASVIYGTNAGGLLGLTDTVSGSKANSFTRCYNATETALSLAPASATLVDCFYLADSTGENGALSAEDMKNPEKFTNYDFENVWTMNASGSDYPYPQIIGNLYGVKSGTITAPSGNICIIPEKVTVYDLPYYLVTCKEEFCYMEIEPTARYIIAADIDLTEGYTPIPSFSGVIRSYDPKLLGNWKTHTITVNSTTGAGIFEDLSATEISYIKIAGSVTAESGKNAGALARLFDAVCKIITCENAANVTGNSSDAVGGFFGSAIGTSTFINCINSGHIKSGTYTGGFIGKSEGGTMTLTGCKHIGKVEGSGLLTGGLIGDIKTAVITSCANEGSVTGYRVAGGLLGGFWSTGGSLVVSKSYNAGTVASNAVSGNAGAGGIIGIALNKVTVTDCYNAAALTSASGIKGAIIATVTYGSTAPEASSITNAYSAGETDVAMAPADVTLNNCFYLSSETNAETGALSSKDMKDSTKFTDFDFTADTGIWEMNPEGSDYPYPQLRDNTYIITIVYGTAQNPYPITSGEEFVELIAEYGGEGKYFILENDISLGDEESEVSYEALDFAGNFNGNNKTIKIYINNELDNQGLFKSALGEITIKNLTIEGSISANSGVGGFIASTTKKFVIDNCINNAAIKSSKNFAGGFVGYTSGSSSTITNCVNNGTIANDVKAAGFVADSQGGNTALTGCINNGDIANEENLAIRAGGLLGYVKYATVDKCANNGDIKAYRYAGGIWAERNGSNTGTVTISDSYNTGNIESAITSSAPSVYGAAGGIIGNVVPGAYNSASGTYYDGGVALSGCYNAGTVSVNADGVGVGGLVGGRYLLDNNIENPEVLVKVSDCYNLGDIYGAGGVIENAPVVFATDNVNKIDISNCYYLAVETEAETDSYDETIAVAIEEFADGILGNTNCYKESSNDYIYPQIPGNINTVPVNMYLVTVAEAENGKISSEGKTFYAKGRNTLTFKAEGDTLAYSVITITVNGESFTENLVEIKIEGDTEISASFAQPAFEVADATVYSSVLSLSALSGQGIDTENLAGKYGAICFTRFSGIYNDDLLDYGIILSEDENPDIASDTFISKKDSDKDSAVAYFCGAKELKDNTYYMAGYIKFTNDDGNEEIIYGTPVSFKLGFVINDI